MLKSSTDILSSIADNLMINSSFLNNLGLLHGRMGVILFFYQYSRHSQDQIYEEFANTLLDDFFEDMNNLLPIDFENGYLGIGWGIEYLAHNDFIDKENLNDVLEDVDSKIMEWNVKRIKDLSLEQGLEGILHYVLFRLYSNKNKSNIFDEAYLTDLFDAVNTIQVDSSKYKTLFTLINSYKTWFHHKFIEYDYISFWNSFCKRNQLQFEEVYDCNLGIVDGYAGVGFNKMK